MTIRAVLLTLLVLALACPAVASGTHEQGEIKTVIERFIKCFNSRDVDAMLALYGEDAKISANVENAVCYISKDEYRPRLERKMAGLARRNIRIVGYRIVDLDYVAPGQAELTVAVKAQAGFIKVVEQGKLRLDRDHAGWRISQDDM